MERTALSFLKEAVRLSVRTSWMFVLMLSLIPISCTERNESADSPDTVRIDFDKSNERLLLNYYIGPYLPEGPDVIETGYVQKVGGSYYLDPDRIRTIPQLSRLVTDGYLDDRVLHWDEFSAFVLDTYYQNRGLPSDLQSLYTESGFRPGDSSWFRVDVRGVMTTALRRIYVREQALRAALSDYLANGRRLLYPPGTFIIGEHWLDTTLAETTVMRKRADGFWDFAIYGADGSLVKETQTPPKTLKAPIQCIGCHTGTKLFEPEKSFPAHARRGPHGPREIYVKDEWRNASVVSFFDEHRKRSDRVLGIYNTLFVSRLLAQKRAGTLPEDDVRLLTTLGL